MPKPDRSTQQLASRYQKRSVPENIMESRAQSPCPQGVEQDLVRLGRLVPMVLVPELFPVVILLKELIEFRPQAINLFLVEQADPSQVTVLMKKRYLFIRQTESVPLFRRSRPGKQFRNGCMVLGIISQLGPPSIQTERH
jgi:hypothetical protein